MKKEKFNLFGCSNKAVEFFVVIMIIGVSICSSSSSKNSSSSSSTCLVDKCAACPTKIDVVCTACKQGWYLRTFTGGDKPYNACWSISKLILGMLTFILLNLICCGICSACYMMGKKTFSRGPITNQDRNYDFSHQEPKRREVSVVYQPEPTRVVQREPVVEYQV